MSARTTSLRRVLEKIDFHFIYDEVKETYGVNGLEKLFPPDKVKTREERNEAIQKAYFDYSYTLTEIVRHLGLH